MLTPDEVTTVTRDLWARHQDEIPQHDRVYEYVRGHRGVPAVPDGSGDELVDLAKMSVKNVLALVVSAFTQSLGVVGFRAASEADDAEAWRLWQLRRMDARQAELVRAAVTYGSAYAVGLKDETRIRSPRQIYAAYADPHMDLWPLYTLESWVDWSEKRGVRRGILYDDEHLYPLTLGRVSRRQVDEEERPQRGRGITVEADGEPVKHDATDDDGPVCPVIRFVNDRDAEDVVVGEVAPLISQQRAINTVNFDRLVVSRYGAFPQKYAIGWVAANEEELARVSAARLMSFDDHPSDVKVGDFAQASVEPYNSILTEMIQHVAMTAQIPPFALTGDILNIAAEAAAMIDAPYQRKLIGKRESLGESHEQHLRLIGRLNGVEVPEEAEVVWRDTEARSFSAVVDGVTKLAATGIPIEQLLDDIPGWTQQQVTSARRAIQRQRGRDTIAALGAVERANSGDTDPAA